MLYQENIVIFAADTTLVTKDKDFDLSKADSFFNQGINTIFQIYQTEIKLRKKTYLRIQTHK